MFKNILVPVDFLEDNVQAVEIAVEMAFRTKGEVTLLHVIEIIAGSSYKEFQEFYAKIEQDSQKEMESLVAPHESGVINIETRIVYGNRTEEILTHAEKNRIDLIILNSHRIDLDNPTSGWGTISHKVGLLSQCPVMLVK
jgi:nucleotide-binding universal stress UspA family protein